MLRWIFLVRFPEGVSLSDGDAWYFEHHVPEAKQMHGLRRYRTWALEPASVPGAGRSLEVLNRWVRLTELAFDDAAAWERAMSDLPALTPAPWADVDRGVPSYISETIFVDDEGLDLLGAGGDD